jgi:uncharacterized membrane protein YkvA (DUF1232 family)
MAECECLPRCPFFNDKMTNMPIMADMTKKAYCMQDPSQCARYIVAAKLGREAVPADLFPNQCDRAGRILEKGR